MTGNLIIPRVRLDWGDTNLTAYDGDGEWPQGEPLVFGITMTLPEDKSLPTGSFQWNPSGPAFKIYESFITDRISEPITIRFYYANGKGFTFITSWVFAGQNISYGNNMSIQVKVTSANAGQINSNQRATTNAPDSPITHKQAIEDLTGKFKLTDKVKIQYEKVAEEYLSKATLNSFYSNSQNYSSTLGNLVWSTGHILTANVINEPSLLITKPLAAGGSEILDGSQETEVDPTKKYGYILGPAIIDTISRDTQFTPPQQTAGGNPNSTALATDTSSAQNPTPTQPLSSTPVPVQNLSSSTTPSTAPQGTSSSASTPGVSNADNPLGSANQNAQTAQNQQSMTTSCFMAPVLTGIKPSDVVYIPSLNGEYIEDWDVKTVTYTQTDGGVTLSINGTRTFNLGTLMVENSWVRDKVKSLQTLENWENYAWPIMEAPAPSAPRAFAAAPATPAAQAREEFSTTRTAAIG
jgi:hypothetical protein